jgi:uncharacterized protein
MDINKELFAIPYKGRVILYAPLNGSVLEVNSGIAKFLMDVKSGIDPRTINPEATTRLIKAGILKETIKESDSPKYIHKREETYLPASVTLVPTYNCNLRCIYCYSMAGENAGEIMKPKIAKAAIDFVIGNAKRLKIKNISLGFHGGGEPLLRENKPLVSYSLAYARAKSKELGLKVQTKVVTNGVHRADMLEWIVKNFNDVTLSLDGPEDIQNAQRPKAGGRDSFRQVLECVRYFETVKAQEGQKFHYALRATITSDSVERMPEIVEFFHSIAPSLKGFHFEPLFECGRCKTTKSKSPDSGLFLEKMVETEEKALRLGVKIDYSGGPIKKRGSTFCGACGSNFFVLPNGRVTTCLEACREGEKIFDVFNIGHFNPKTQRFEFYIDKIKKLKERVIENMPSCRDCFAKYNCSGDCPTKIYEQTGNILNTSNNWRCEINRGVLLNRLVSALINSKGEPTEV